MSETQDPPMLLWWVWL